MKNFKVSIFALCLGMFLISSCKKESSSSSSELKTADYTSSISQQRITLAKSLAAAFSANQEMANVTMNECAKKFDGDRDVLCKVLFEKPAGLLKSTGNTFGSILNGYVASGSLSTMKSSSAENSTTTSPSNFPPPSYTATS